MKSVTKLLDDNGKNVSESQKIGDPLAFTNTYVADVGVAVDRAEPSDRQWLLVGGSIGGLAVLLVGSGWRLEQQEASRLRRFLGLDCPTNLRRAVQPCITNFVDPEHVGLRIPLAETNTTSTTQGEGILMKMRKLFAGIAAAATLLGGMALERGKRTG